MRGVGTLRPSRIYLQRKNFATLDPFRAATLTFLKWEVQSHHITCKVSSISLKKVIILLKCIVKR